MFVYFVLHILLTLWILQVPVGGVKVINNPNIFAGQDIKKLLKNKRQSSSESSENEVPKNEPNKFKKEIQENRNNVKNAEETLSGASQKDNKINNLFEDDDEEDELFQNDLFSNFSCKTTSNLFGKTSDGLFDDSDEFHEEDRLDNAKTMSSTKITESKQPIEVVEKNISMRSDQSNHVNPVTSQGKPKKFDDPLFESETDHFVNKTGENIFAADDESDSDDLFSSKYSKIISKNKVIEHISSNSEKKNTHISEEVTSSKEIKDKSKKVPSLFDNDDEDNQSDDLFSSNFLQRNKEAHSTQKIDSKLDSKLFEEDGDEDDLFSTNDVLNDNRNSIFEDRNLIKEKNVSDSLKKPNAFIKDVSVESSASSKEETDIFQSKTKTKGLTSEVVTVEENDIIKNTTDESLLVQRSPVLDNLFDDDSGKHLLESKSPEESQKEVVVTDTATVKEHTLDDLQISSDGIPNEEHSSQLKKNIKDIVINNKSNESLTNDSDAYDNVDRAILEPKSSIIDNLTENLFVHESEKPKKENEPTNSENIVPVIKEEHIEASFLNNSVPSAESTFSPTADRIPSLNIFDPNPPPDLNDWETPSEHNIFYDDIYSFDNTENFNENRSSIFDREPPSVFNETSGIVRDQSRG